MSILLFSVAEYDKKASATVLDAVIFAVDGRSGLEMRLSSIPSQRPQATKLFHTHRTSVAIPSCISVRMFSCERISSPDKMLSDNVFEKDSIVFVIFGSVDRGRKKGFCDGSGLM